MELRENVLSCEKVNIEDLEITPILEKNTTAFKFEKTIKRLTDILGGAIGVLALVPLTVIIWIAIG